MEDFKQAYNNIYRECTLTYKWRKSINQTVDTLKWNTLNRHITKDTVNILKNMNERPQTGI